MLFRLYQGASSPPGSPLVRLYSAPSSRNSDLSSRRASRSRGLGSRSIRARSLAMVRGVASYQPIPML